MCKALKFGSYKIDNWSFSNNVWIYRNISFFKFNKYFPTLLEGRGALDINTRYPFKNIDMDSGNPPTLTDKTDAEVETMVDDWCTEKNVS